MLYNNIGNSKNNNGKRTTTAQCQMRNMGPPANFVQEMTPEKEEQIKDGSHFENADKSPLEQFQDLDSFLNNNNGNYDDYSTLEDKDHPDYGINGFLDANRFKSGDNLPLLNEQVNGTEKVPAGLTLNGNRVHKSKESRSASTTTNNSTTTNTTATTWNVLYGGGGGKDGSNGIDDYEYGTYTAGDNPVFEPNAFGNTPHQQRYSFDTLKWDASKQQKLVGNNSSSGIIKYANDENVMHKMPTMHTLTSNTGTNTTNYRTNGANLTQSDHHYSPPNPLGQRQQQFSKKPAKKRKQQLKDKGQIINPQNQPGYIGDKEVDDIMKALGEETERNKANGPTQNGGAGIKTGENNRQSKRGNRKQKQHQQKLSPGGTKKLQEQHVSQSSFTESRQESFASPVAADEEEVEDMEVGIELDNEYSATAAEKQDQEQQPQQTQQEEEEKKEVAKSAEAIDEEKEQQREESAQSAPPPQPIVEEEKQEQQPSEAKKTGTGGGDTAATTKKAPWCSTSLAANKHKWQQQQKIRETPLLDRIPANLLAEFKWKCPITIVFPKFSDSRKQREQIWNKPAEMEQAPPQTTGKQSSS